MKLTSKTLQEIIKDFLKTDLEINTESFIEWFGLNLNEKDFEMVGNKIYELG
jgi:hypothetical protein